MQIQKMQEGGKEKCREIQVQDNSRKMEKEIKKKEIENINRY